MSDTSKQGCWLCSQTEIFLKQTFKAWWGPLDAYVSVNPIQTVLRINMAKDCCSSSDVYVALQEPFSHRLLESSAPKNRPHAGPARHGKTGLRVSTALLFHRATRLL